MDTTSQDKFVYLYDPENQAVAMFHTTDRKGAYLLQVVNTNFPFNSINAWEYFRQLWQKALLFNPHSMKFLHWVNPVTFEPLSE
jgi:hypothetical protein